MDNMLETFSLYGSFNHKMIVALRDFFPCLYNCNTKP